jgi:hypothetical protein
MPDKDKAMDKTDFMNIMQLAHADVKVVDPDAIGIALMVVHRTASGDIQLQIGSNIPEEALLEAVLDDLRHKRKTRHG